VPPVAKFLSEEWIRRARQVYEEYRDRAPSVVQEVRVNQVITDVPFGDGTILAHADTSSGKLVIDEGHLDDADTSLTTDYETARALLFDRQSALPAFMQGKMRVEGDMTKLIAIIQAPPDPLSLEIQQRILEFTD
jgi:hypothetical protein